MTSKAKKTNAATSQSILFANTFIHRKDSSHVVVTLTTSLLPLLFCSCLCLTYFVVEWVHPSDNTTTFITTGPSLRPTWFLWWYTLPWLLLCCKQSKNESRAFYFLIQNTNNTVLTTSNIILNANHQQGGTFHFILNFLILLRNQNMIFELILSPT